MGDHFGRGLLGTVLLDGYAREDVPVCVSEIELAGLLIPAECDAKERVVGDHARRNPCLFLLHVGTRRLCPNRSPGANFCAF